MSDTPEGSSDALPHHPRRTRRRRAGRGSPARRARAGPAFRRDARGHARHPFGPRTGGDAGLAEACLGGEMIEAVRRAELTTRERVRAAFGSACGAGPAAVWREAEGDPAALL